MSYNKKALLSIVKKLDKAKAPGKPKDVKIINQNGQRKYPGQVTEIQGDTIATDGYGYIPLMVVPNNGEGPQMIMPNTGEHRFNGATSFTEYPVNDQDFYEDDLDEEQIAELRAGGYIVEDISVPQLTQAQKGTVVKDNIIYPPGDSEYMNQPALNYDIIEMLNQKARRDYEQNIRDKVDPTNLNRTSPRYQQEFMMNQGLIQAQVGGQKEGEVLDIPEMQAYADPNKRKQQNKLIDKARAIASTIEGRQALKQGNYKDFSIESMKKFIKSATDYKKEAEDYHKARRLVSEEKMDPGSFARRYNEKGWAKFDEATANENYEGEYQGAVDKANKRKAKNMGYTDTVLELTGAPALLRIAADPIGTAKGVGQTIGDLATLPYGVAEGAYNYATNGNFDMGTNAFGQKYGEGVNETLDALTVLPFVSYLGKGANLAKPALIKGANKLGKTLGTETGLLSNTRKINPWAENLNDPLKSYRVAGMDAAKDFENSGVLRSVAPKIKANFAEGILPARTTSFPSFQKGYADLSYANPNGSVVFETNLPTFKRGDLNPITGQQIKGRHYAHRVIDPKTGATMTEIPGSEIRMFGDKPHWLKGYKEVPKKVSGASKKMDIKLLPDDVRSKELDMETFGVYKGDKKVGEISGNKLSNGDFETLDIGIDPKFQKQGIGTEVYRQLNQSLPEGNKVRSWGAFVENNGVAPGRNTWQSLERQGLAKQNEKGIYEMLPNSSSGSDEILKSGFDGNFITRPLTPFSKNELTPGKQWYRKIGNEAGLKDLIKKQGAQAPKPMMMKSGITLDAPFFGIGTEPAESYKGLYALEVKPDAASKYRWKSRVAGVDNYGSVPFENNMPLQNLPLEDLNVYRKKWFSNNYKKLDPDNLEKGLRNAALQKNLEKAYKWGARGYLGKSGYDYIEEKEAASKKARGYEEGGFLPQAQAGIIQGAPTPTGLIQQRPKSIMNMSQADAKKVLTEEKKQKQIALQEKNQPRYQPVAPAVSESTRTGIPNEVVAAIQNAIYMESPEYKAEQEAKKAAQAQFEKEQWAKYNNMTLGEKAVDRTNAFLNQGFLMGANALAGEQAYIPGMAAGLDPSSSDYDNYLNATNQTRGLSLNDAVNVFNPGNWGGHAGRQYGEGNYATGAAELGLGLLGARGVPIGTTLAKSSANKLINLEESLNTGLLNNLSKSKNAKQLVGSLKGLPPEGALPRLSLEDLKAYRQVQEIGRLKAKNNNIVEQYEYALKQGLPEEHLQKVFNKSKEEIEKEIPLIRPRVERQQALNSSNESINLTRPGRSPIRPIPLEEGNVANTLLNNTSTTEELTAMANSLGMSGDELARFRDTSRYSRDNIIRHSLEDNAARQHMRESDYWENLARNVDALAPPPGEFILNTQNFRNAVTNYGPSKRLSLPKLDQDKLLNYISEHPYYKERNVLQNVPSLSLEGSGSLKNVSDKVASRSTANIKSGDVFTGSLSTSHSSYLPQLKQVFKYKEGQPQFLGYQPMNSMGYLSNYNYSADDIAKYLNTEIDEQIKRGIIPGNIQRPYVKQVRSTKGQTLIPNGTQRRSTRTAGSVLLPHYGIKQFEEGGFIDADLTDEEIKQYEMDGYVIEYLP